MSQRCNVMLANCCAWNYTVCKQPSHNYFRIFAFQPNIRSLCVDTSNMAAWFWWRHFTSSIVDAGTLFIGVRWRPGNWVVYWRIATKTKLKRKFKASWQSSCVVDNACSVEMRSRYGRSLRYVNFGIALPSSRERPSVCQFGGECANHSATQSAPINSAAGAAPGILPCVIRLHPDQCQVWQRDTCDRVTHAGTNSRYLGVDTAGSCEHSTCCVTSRHVTTRQALRVAQDVTCRACCSVLVQTWRTTKKRYCSRVKDIIFYYYLLFQLTNKIKFHSTHKIIYSKR